MRKNGIKFGDKDFVILMMANKKDRLILVAHINCHKEFNADPIKLIQYQQAINGFIFKIMNYYKSSNHYYIILYYFYIYIIQNNQFIIILKLPNKFNAEIIHFIFNIILYINITVYLNNI